MKPLFSGHRCKCNNKNQRFWKDMERLHIICLICRIDGFEIEGSRSGKFLNQALCCLLAAFLDENLERNGGTNIKPINIATVKLITFIGRRMRRVWCCLPCFWTYGSATSGITGRTPRHESIISTILSRTAFDPYPAVSPRTKPISVVTSLWAFFV